MTSGRQRRGLTTPVYLKAVESNLRDLSNEKELDPTSVPPCVSLGTLQLHGVGPTTWPLPHSPTRRVCPPFVTVRR